MEKNLVARAEEYYKLFGEKNAEGIKTYLHPDVEIAGPKETLAGKDAVIEAAIGFMHAFESITIRAKFGTEDQALIVYDIHFPGTEKKLSAAALLSFCDGLIIRNELFYDSSPFT